MSLPPDRDHAPPSAEIARRRMSVGVARGDVRRIADPNRIARRRRVLRWTKYVLPAGALLLLGSIAAWPEIERSLNAARIGIDAAKRVNVQSGHMVGARYRGLDAHNRPFTITADDALQAHPQDATAAPPAAGSRTADADDRINLRSPVADTVGDGGSWIRVNGDKGVYLQHEQQLDLDHDVMLYRDDGIMMTGPVADLDLRRGVVASSDWVHAEGPFGQLDAQGYLMSQRDGIAQFRGPGRLVLNDDKIARGPAPGSALATAGRALPARAADAGKAQRSDGAVR